jgi:hypothetical protein
VSAPTVTPAARRLAKAAGVRPVAAQRVLDGLEVWPGTYEAVSAVALACGVVGLPEPAPRASRRPPPRPCPACAAKDAELAEVRAHLVEQSRVWSEACDERDTARSELAALRARVAELEAARAPAPAVVTPPAPERRPAPRPESPRPAPRPRCHVTLEHEGVDLLAKSVAS